MSREKIVDCGCPPERGHRDSCPTLTAAEWPDGTPKIAPVQGYIQGIPWALHLEAYNAYQEKWGGQAALIDLDRRGCRGGFGTGELDEFVPGWRERVAIEATLRRRIAVLEALLHRLAERTIEYVNEEPADDEEEEFLDCDAEMRALAKEARALLSEARGIK